MPADDASHLPAMWDHWCSEHRRQEIPDGSTAYYLACRECGHAFMTAEEMESTYRDVTGRDSSRAHTPAYDIPFCPVCLTDFYRAP